MTAPTTRTLGKDDWMTPANLFDQVHEMCEFDLDACATNLDAARIDPFIDPKTNALRVKWSDYGKRVWCNPPYGRGIDKWFKKAAQACLHGCHLVTLLVYANTDTKYWHRWVANCPHTLCVVFLAPRVKFVRPDGEQAKGAPKGSALIFYTPVPRPVAFLPHLYWHYETEPFVVVGQRLSEMTQDGR